MKHSYFSNYFMICLPTIFSLAEIIVELFVVCQNIIIIFVFTVINKEILK